MKRVYSNAWRNDNGIYVFKIEAPGFDSSDVSIEKCGEYLGVTFSDKDENNSIQYFIITPSYFNLKKLKAVMKYGVLTITVPDKDEELKFTVE